MGTIQDRLNVITSDRNYLGHEVYANKIEKCIEVIIIYYDKSLWQNGKATQNVEIWVVPNATLENFLTKEAYNVNITISHSIRQILGSYNRMFRGQI